MNRRKKFYKIHLWIKILRYQSRVHDDYKWFRLEEWSSILPLILALVIDDASFGELNLNSWKISTIGAQVDLQTGRGDMMS